MATKTTDGRPPIGKLPIDRVFGGKVEKGAGTQHDEGFKPTAPANLVLPKPTPAPKAPPKQK